MFLRVVRDAIIVGAVAVLFLNACTHQPTAPICVSTYAETGDGCD